MLVVLDGVSNTDDSDMASLAGARAALEVLRTPLPRGMGTPESRLSAVTSVFADAVDAANNAVVGLDPGGLGAPAVGDVRRRDRRGLRAVVRQRRRLPRLLAARRRPGGSSSPSTTRPRRSRSRPACPGRRRSPGPRGTRSPAGSVGTRPTSSRGSGQMTLDAAGWVLVCSDGLWNYASEPDALVAQITAAGDQRSRGAGRGADRLRQRAGRRGQHHRRPRPDRDRAECREHPPTQWRRRSPMAEFTAAVYQNEFLADGGHGRQRDRHDHVRRRRHRRPDRRRLCRRDHHRRHLGLDGPGDDGGRQAGGPGRDGRDRRRHLVRGRWRARTARCWPTRRSRRVPGWCRWTRAPAARPRRRSAPFVGSGGTAISTWLELAGTLFASVPEVTQRHAILLTDGENREDPTKLDAAIRKATGVFQCDCRGAGTDWQVEEIRRIAQALLGTVDIIPEPDRDAGAVPGDDAHLDEPRRRRRPAPRVDASGCPGALRPPGLADRGGPHRPPGRGQPAHRWLSHRRLGRRVPRLPRRRTSGREGDRAGAAGGPRAARARREPRHAGAGQGDLVQRLGADREDRPAGRPLHGSDRARRDDPGGPGRQGRGRRGDRDHQARPRRPAGRRDRQRRGDLQAAQGGRRRGREGRHRPAQGAVDKADEMALDTASTKTTRIKK